ncbi:MAG TPA: hypothetical protein VMG99_03800 [Thermoplasmata archaeon]|nr:hypothetical protein [Thermoplasmata archaeon]
MEPSTRGAIAGCLFAGAAMISFVSYLVTNSLLSLLAGGLFALAGAVWLVRAFRPPVAPAPGPAAPAGGAKSS